jgi:hypothetical protein
MGAPYIYDISQLRVNQILMGGDIPQELNSTYKCPIYKKRG